MDNNIWQKDMEEHLIQHSQEHFRQVHGTPFTTDPLTMLLGFDGMSPFGYLIFAGQPIPTTIDINPETWLLLWHQQSILQPNETIDHPLDFELLMKGIRKWLEHTATSPSGHHLGIYKALLKDQRPTTPPPDYVPHTHGIDVMHYVYWLMKLAI